MVRHAGMIPDRVDVGGPVGQIVLSPSGTIFAVTSNGMLICLGGSCRKAWERRWPTSRSQPITLRVAEDGRSWIGLGDSLIEIDHDGNDRTRLSLDQGDRERLGSFLLAPDGFYACLYRPGMSGHMEPRITKLDPSGSLLWSTTLPVGTIGYRGVVEAGVHTGWEIRPKRPWRPQTWTPVRYGGSEPLLLSGNRLLASFFEFPSSGIGCSYALDAESGAILWVTDPAPTHTLAIAGKGRFYHGLQGYGAFETRLLGPDGTLQRRWKSHGHLVIDEGGRVHCVEMENVLPSRMRFVTLEVDGSVGDGPLLDGYDSTYPAISREGVVAFWRHGGLVLIDEAKTKEILVTDPSVAEEGPMTRMLLSPDGSLVFAVGSEVWMVDAGLGKLAESPWPCGWGNIQGNPVWL